MRDAKYILIIAILACLPVGLVAQSYVIKQYAFSNGAGHTQSSTYKLKATIGQAVVGSTASASFVLTAGFDAGITNSVRLPDLLLTQGNINPAQVAPGGKTAATFTLSNTGDQNIEQDIVVRAFLSANTQLDSADVKLATFIVSASLGVGQSVNFPINAGQSNEILIPSSTAQGSYQVILSADPFFVLTEKNELNNYQAVPVTISVDGGGGPDITGPVVTNISAGNFISGTSITATVTDNRSVSNVSFYYRPVTGDAFLQVPMTGIGSLYTVVMQDEWPDELGVQSYIIAADAAGNKSDSASSVRFWYREADPSSKINFDSPFGGSQNTYAMFSIPYEITKNDVRTIFDELGAYDNTKWRLFHYRAGKYIENDNGFTSIEPGKGYWINMKDKTDVAIGEGVVVEANQHAPFSIMLQPGWNQIGNPYPFNISWDAIVAGNDKVGSLNLFKNGNYTKSDVLKPWEGAFVHADEVTQLTIPVTAKTNASGRQRHHELTPALDTEEWLLPITLHINGLRQISGLGMHPRASVSKDRFDEITLPRFLDYAEMNTYHKEFVTPYFSTDVVPTADEYTWTFEVKSNLEDQHAELTWDQTALADNQSSLILIDLREGNWVDMTTLGSYSFRHGDDRQLRIVYNRDGEINPGVTLLGEAYPNPFTTEVRFPLLVDEPGLKQIEVYDGFGRLITRIATDIRERGIQEVVWDTRENHASSPSSGVLYYRLLDKNNYKVKRLIKQ